MHEVSILNVDKEGSLNLDQDSEENFPPQIGVSLDGQIMENRKTVDKGLLSPDSLLLNDSIGGQPNSPEVEVESVSLGSDLSRKNDDLSPNLMMMKKDINF